VEIQLTDQIHESRVKARNKTNGERRMSDLTMKLPTELVERAVRDKINAAIASQLGDPEVLIGKLVANALSMKVNQSGVVGRSSYENTEDYLELISGQFIREAAKEALREFFDENKSKIKECVKKEVAKSPSKMAKVFMDGITAGMTATYGSTIEITFENKRNDY